MDELDKFIEDIVSKKISEHVKYENTIKNALKENNKKVKAINIVRRAAIIVVCISTIGGVVFANQIMNIINNITKKNSDYSVHDNESIQKINMEYKTKDNLSIKIDSILVDDFNIQLNIDYLYSEAITSAESKILIKDEKNNLIFEIDDFELVSYFEDTFKKENRHKYGEVVINEEKIVSDTKNDKQIQEFEFTTNHKSLYQNYAEKNLKRQLNLYTDLDSEKFPESKKLYIQLEDITLRNGSNIVKEIKSEWNFEIELSEKFLNRKNSIYTQENMNNDEQEFTVIKAESSNTQFKLKMRYLGEQELKQLIDTLDLGSIQVFNKKNNQYINAETIEILDDNIIKVNYSIDKDNLSDILIIKIKNVNEIEITKNKS